MKRYHHDADLAAARRRRTREIDSEMKRHGSTSCISI